MTATTSPARSARGFPLWAKFALGIFVVLLMIALALPHFLNVDHYRNDITDALAKQTGHKITLGSIRAQFLPGVGVILEGMHVANPDGFPAGDVLSADQIRVSVALGPLLHRTIHVDSVELVRPRLFLVTDSSGKNNYTFAPTTAAPGAPATVPSTSTSVSLDEIENINLTDAEVLVGAVVRGAVLASADTKGINIALHNFVLAPMRVHDWQAESKLTGVTLTLEGWSEPVSFQAGQVTLSGGKMDAQFVADLAKASDIKGTLSIPDVEQPQVNFELSASQLDIDKLIAAAGGGSSSASATPTKAAAAQSPKAPGTLVAQGHINVEKITTKPYTVGPANVEMRVYTDRAELFPISIGMYGGTLQISSRVDRSTVPPRFTANVQMRNLDVAKVLDVTPSARGKMGGTGELDLQLLGSLSDDWKKTLSGTGKFAVRNGHLPGVNLAGLAPSLAKIASVGGDTPFTALEGDVTIASQRVSSKQIHLDSSVGIVDLKGSLGLDSTLDYQGSATINPATALGTKGLGGILGGLLGANVGKITVPFALTGTIDHPKVSPGRGAPTFGAPSASDAPPNSGQPAAANPADAIKSLFKKH